MEALLSIHDLRIEYKMQDGVVKALNGVDLEIGAGTSHGLVGETGAGKTTMAKGIMGLTPKPYGKIRSGEILYNGKNLLTMTNRELRKIRGEHISMIFQDPMTSLNPVITVGDQIAEAIEVHQQCGKKQAAQRVAEILELVGIAPERASDYPHQFSGGMKQRVVIGIALVCSPKLLIADEPTTALDVTIQAQVLEKITELQQKMNTALLLITHDLGVVAQNCQYVSVIYAGEIVESGTVRDVFKRKLHPYTRGLFSSIPNINERVERLVPIPGLMPDPTALPPGCAFCERCAEAKERCWTEHPPMYHVGGEEGCHQVRCFLCEGREV